MAQQAPSVSHQQALLRFLIPEPLPPTPALPEDVQRQVGEQIARLLLLLVLDLETGKSQHEPRR
ncbi:MAG: hypothetical protein HY812_13695 [Planctomycetes bacterium]|nr:hypothetical protein [Planctomycetota bacterium]